MSCFRWECYRCHRIWEQDFHTPEGRAWRGCPDHGRSYLLLIIHRCHWQECSWPIPYDREFCSTEHQRMAAYA